MVTLLLQNSEFWAAIAGAIVGGGISFGVQLVALRAARLQRADDIKRVDQALGNSLLFKVVRIHSNLVGLRRHFDECSLRRNRRGDQLEPWQFFLPLANPPPLISFAADEMGMLLAQRNDKVFNDVMSLDIAHNNLFEALKVLNEERRALTASLNANSADGTVLAGHLERDDFMRLRPKMIAVNTLFEALHLQASENSTLSEKRLSELLAVLRDSLGLKYRIEPGARSEFQA